METSENENQELKHLGFVRVAAIQTLACLSSLYDYAKQNSGPLRSTVYRVEGAVTTVVAPVYEKFKGFPDHLLVFLDKQVDVAAAEFDEHAPALAKQVAGQVHSVVKKASGMAQDIVNQAQTGGPKAAVHYAAAESKQLVLNGTVKVWSRLDQVPPFHTVAEIAVPTAAHWLEKYNRVVSDLSRKGYPLFDYVPLVPLDDIAKAFKENESPAQPASEAERS